MKQYGLSRSYYNEEMSSARTLDLLPRYTVSIAYKVGGYSNIPDIVINFTNSFSFAITKYTQLLRILRVVIIVYSNNIAYNDQIHISKDLYLGVKRRCQRFEEPSFSFKTNLGFQFKRRLTHDFCTHMH